MSKQDPVFDITDYTTASDWERFIANLEEIISSWNLNKQGEKYQELPQGAITRGIWHEEQEFIKHGSMVFQVKYLRLDYKSTSANESSEIFDDCALDNSEDEVPECLRDLVSSNNDFASRAHCLVRWYNFRRFIILSPRGDTLISGDAVRLALSSASIALANVGCQVPILIQHHNPRNFLYQGISEHKSIRTTFEMIYIKSSMKQYQYLSELISLFRNKVSCQMSDPITVSVRLNYCLNNFRFIKPVENEIKSEPKGPSQTTTTTTRSVIMDLKKDATFEQVLEVIKQGNPKPHRILQFIHVAALWPPVSDKVIVDSQVHTDLDAAEAPIWTMRSITSDNSNMKMVHDTQALYDMFCDSIDYAYTQLDADTVFEDCDRRTLKDRCLNISYRLAKEPEIVLSTQQSDSVRKIIALLYHRASQVNRQEDETPDPTEIEQLSLNEIYRNFGRNNHPSIKEFIIRSEISRPFQPEIMQSLPQRMFCSITNSDFRLCGAFSESTS